MYEMIDYIFLSEDVDKGSGYEQKPCRFNFSFILKITVISV